jgi:HSP20 family protein
MRQFSLGDGIDVEHISASYENGVLSVIIPLAERAKPRKVQVETARGASAASAITV